MKIYKAFNFNDICEISKFCLFEDGSDFEKSEAVQPLWFRGHTKNEYRLLPSIYRGLESKLNDNRTYSNLHLHEDFRFHSFRAKTGHQITSNPSIKIEWQEIMQHHSMKTRLLDFSESAISALIFALEPLFSSADDLTVRQKRRGMDPAIYIVSPQKLNERVFEVITSPDEMGNYPYIEVALRSLLPELRKNRRKARELGEELGRNRGIYFDLGAFSGMNMLFNLSAIEAEKHNYSDLARAVLSYEFNPLYYIILRLYADGLPVSLMGERGESVLPPLATIHQYHSSRIQAQRGVFLMSPNYVLGGEGERLFKRGKDLRAIEEREGSDEYAAKVRIVDPRGLARELMAFGERQSSIYPELEVYAKVLEADKYFV